MTDNGTKPSQGHSSGKNQALLEALREHMLWEQTIGTIGVPKLEEKKPETAQPKIDVNPVRKLEILAQEAAQCMKCDLHKTRTRSVFARGNPFSELVFVGEGPGYHEDQQGEPFVGQAGKLLDKMIQAMGFKREDVYICNAVKCRPPENRTPLPHESAACNHFLDAQLTTIQPKAIVTLGRCATEALGVCEVGAKIWRGVWGEWKTIPVMATYHPAFLLRSPQFKKPVWEDLQKVMSKLGVERARK